MSNYHSLLLHSSTQYWSFHLLNSLSVITIRLLNKQKQHQCNSEVTLPMNKSRLHFASMRPILISSIINFHNSLFCFMAARNNTLSVTNHYYQECTKKYKHSK